MCISCFRDSKSASVFCVPGTCVADNDTEESEAHCDISFVTGLHYCEVLVPNLFMHATALSCQSTLLYELLLDFLPKLSNQTRLLSALEH